MEARSLNYITSACGGQQTGGASETMIERICTDSRQVQPGDLFLALAGDKFDGHNFLAEVIEKGAAAVLINGDRKPASAPYPLIAVENTRQALGQIAARYRQDFELPVVAIGGSNGKTSTKELVAAVLRKKCATVWSEASFNNDIGVPHTLLKIEKNHEAAVLEVGTNHSGELAPLVRMIQPRLGVITSIGREHLEFFGDLEGVVREEGWLGELLPSDGKLFLNGEGEWTDQLAKRTKAQVVRIGLNNVNDWYATSVRADQAGSTFELIGPKTYLNGEYRINLLGRHQVLNSLFAIAIGAELGLSYAEIAGGLVDCKPAKMRLQLSDVNGVQVLDDAYNANADSMLAALQTLQELPCRGKRVAILGEMAELGVHSVSGHEEVGRKTAERGIDRLVAVGKMASVVGSAARDAGMRDVFEFIDTDSLVKELGRLAKPGDLVLLKASRSARLERVADALREVNR